MLRGAAFEQAGAAIKAAVKILFKISRKALSSEARAGFLGDFGDDLAGGGIDLGLGQGLLARLQGDGYGDRFLTFRYGLAFIDIKNADVRDECASARDGGLYDVGRLHRTVDEEGEVALHGHEFRKFEFRFGFCGPQFRRWYVIEEQLETGGRPLGAKGFEGARMDLAKRANDIFWPKLDRRGAAGMKPRWSAGNDLHGARRHAKRRKKRERVRLGVERIDPGGRHRPMFPASRFLRQAPPDRARGGLLTVFPIT